MTETSAVSEAAPVPVSAQNAALATSASGDAILKLTNVHTFYGRIRAL